ncbi:GDSL-type esterase/lipase family protein [Nocardiopsis sp. L17-MgMaSL7]|uniref:GDSL-type esterase/lipase family protein n=1 Tax=Nocardiopsis sp. L17-MgMaSL7 TaxID=1938893 RepID=UPI000D80A951|nr:GDSL-type esterase/lipase family protein [Nocardiopsis sp. L17-MgMaSL7]PWV52889.1 GDSL-like lipase/acylhydrolase family protein [Nocardiopsis sp. L17-MgMaSL7]
MAPRQAPRPGLGRPARLAGVLTLLLALVGSGLWLVTRVGPGDPDPTDDRAPGAWMEERSRVRVMLAGDSMTHGAGGDRTWRFHLWNHLDPHVENLDFVGPYSDPATPEQIIPPELFGGDEDAERDAEGEGEPGVGQGGHLGSPEERRAERPFEGPAPAEGLDPSGFPDLPDPSGAPDGRTYRDPDFDQDHNARWGRTLADALTTIGADVATHQPDVLCVLIGINDLLHPITAEEMEQRLRAYVQAARESNPRIRVLFAEAPPITLADKDQGFALRVYVYNELVRSVAADTATEESPVASFDLAGAESWDPHTDTYDGTHPNDGGEMKIAAGFADALSREFGLGPAHARPLPIHP